MEATTGLNCTRLECKFAGTVPEAVWTEMLELYQIGM